MAVSSDDQRDSQPVVETLSSPVPHTLSTSKYDRSLSIHGWHISTSKRPISNAKEIDALSDALTIPVPEMIFGNNLIRIANEDLGVDLRFTAADALDCVNKEGTDLKVSYSDDWNKTRDEHSEEIRHVTKPFDWTYTTDYRGTLGPSHLDHLSLHPPPTTTTSQNVVESNGADADGTQDTTSSSSTHTRKRNVGVPRWVETEERLPMDLLRRQDPILFYDDVILYESELDDNGTSLLSSRIRCMPSRLLLLTRFFMRLDDVTFRVNETRVYVEFQSGVVMREYLSRVGGYVDVKGRVRECERDRSGELMSDAAWVSGHCEIVDGKMEILKYE